MTNAKAITWGFGVAAVLAILAALIPLLKGDRLNVPFLSIGVVFLVLAATVAKKGQPPGNPPPAA